MERDLSIGEYEKLNPTLSIKWEGKEIIFCVPNKLTLWRVKSLMTKEPETIEWIKSWLDNLEKLPDDRQNQPSTTAAAKRLLETACDLEISPGISLQWFAIRLDPPVP